MQCLLIIFRLENFELNPSVPCNNKLPLQMTDDMTAYSRRTVPGDVKECCVKNYAPPSYLHQARKCLLVGASCAEVPLGYQRYIQSLAVFHCEQWKLETLAIGIKPSHGLCVPRGQWRTHC